jgi:hypothetical protein
MLPPAIAPTDNSGKPRCYRCWHPCEHYTNRHGQPSLRMVDHSGGRGLRRTGTTLTCLDCGDTMREPVDITLARLTALVERPHSRIATRRLGPGRRRSLTLEVRP